MGFSLYVKGNQTNEIIYLGKYYGYVKGDILSKQKSFNLLKSLDKEINEDFFNYCLGYEIDMKKDYAEKFIFMYIYEKNKLECYNNITLQGLYDALQIVKHNKTINFEWI